MTRAALLLAGALGLTGCTTRALPPADPAPPPITILTQQVRPGDLVPAGMQYLYGSGEAAALSEQAYNALTRYVGDVVADMRVSKGVARPQAVLAPGATPERPTPLSCGTLPPAIVLDMDETVVLNLGYEYHDAQTGASYDPKRWDRWERTGADRVVAVPGARRAFERVRAQGVTVVINTNRAAANAADTAAALANAGLGEFRHGETLFLKGDVDGRSGKDGRRQAIAARYCVIAQAGDQLGDFADFFNPPGPAPAAGRRALASAPAIAPLWGNGWFVLPNPVYGTGLGTRWDDTFPADKRWNDGGAK